MMVQNPDNTGKNLEKHLSWHVIGESRQSAPLNHSHCETPMAHKWGFSYSVTDIIYKSKYVGALTVQGNANRLWLSKQTTLLVMKMWQWSGNENDNRFYSVSRRNCWHLGWNVLFIPKYATAALRHETSIRGRMHFDWFCISLTTRWGHLHFLCCHDNRIQFSHLLFFWVID